jgi:hypothetical protein
MDGDVLFKACDMKCAIQIHENCEGGKCKEFFNEE